jgi:group I intron endonuclease
MGYRAIDQYSLLHLSVGVIAYFWSISLFTTIFIHILFEIIENCQSEDLLIKEQFYIDTLLPQFNIGKHSSGGDNLTNNPNREDIINRIGKSVRENLVLMTDEERKEKWSRPGEKNPNYNNKWTDEMKKNLSDFQKNNIDNPLRKRKNRTNIDLYGEEKAKEISDKLSIHASSRIGEKNPFFNKHHSDKTKEILKTKLKGNKPPNRIKISIDNVVYESYHDASKKLNIPIVTIRWRCLSNNSKFINYQLI